MQYSYDLFVKELGAKLKQMRKSRGWTLRDMVIEHRLHQTQWQRLENGKGIATPSLLRVCEVFGVGLSELVGDLGQLGRGEAPAADVPGEVKQAGTAPAKGVKGSKKAAFARGKSKTSPA